MFREGALVTFGRYQTLVSSINLEIAKIFSILLFCLEKLLGGIGCLKFTQSPCYRALTLLSCCVLFVQNILHAQHFFLYLALTLFPNAIRVNLVELPI